MAVWPEKDSDDWDVPLKVYIDENDAKALNDAEALIPGAVGEAVDGNQRGSLVLYVPKTSPSPWTTTAVSPATAALMSGVIVGTGKQIKIEFTVGQVRHTIANTKVFFALSAQKAGSAASNVQIVPVSSSSVSVGEPVQLVYYHTIPVGEEWTYSVLVAAAAAGTTTVAIGGTSPAYLTGTVC